MEKTIKVGEYEFAAKSTAASLFSYKSNFGRDGLRDILALGKGIKKDGENEIDVEQFDIDVFFRFMWVFAKACDKSIPPMEEWLEGFDIAPFDFVKEALPQVYELLGKTVNSSVKSKN